MLISEERGKACSMYMKKKRRNRIIVLEDLDFIWDEQELYELTDMHRNGSTLKEISNYFKRDIDEVILALLHLERSDETESNEEIAMNDLKRANLAQLRYIARYTRFRTLALNEFERRMNKYEF